MIDSVLNAAVRPGAYSNRPGVLISGFKDKVNNHYLKLFGQTFLLSAIQALPAQISDTPTASGADDEFGKIADANYSRMGEKLIDRNLSIQPTIRIRPGYPVPDHGQQGHAVPEGLRGMRIVAFAIICILLQSGFTVAAAATFALGAVRQATSAAPQEYVVEVDVAADGYSTFSANIVGDTDAMRLIRKWVAVEREQGVDVVITTTETIETPRIITLIAQYQGRERAGRYRLQPVISALEDTATVTVMAENPGKHEEPGKIGSEIIGLEKTGSEKIELEKIELEKIEPVCPNLIVRKGSLMANVKRLTAHCGHRTGIWYPGNSQDLVDWVVETGRLLENNQGAAGLLNMLKQDYGLLGVMRSEGSDRYIDYYELPGGQ